jgi:very-short-patch-repair endonuclease
MYTCSKCSKSFKTQAAVNAHQQAHNPILLKLKKINIQKSLQTQAKNREELISKYLLQPNKCLHCDAIIPYLTRRNIFCSSSCSAAHTNIGRVMSEHTKQLISQTQKNKIRPVRIPKEYNLICVECNNEFTTIHKNNKTCSKRCKNIQNSKSSSEWLRLNRSHIKGPRIQSYLESSFEAWLISNNILRGLHGYLTEVYFYNKLTKKNGWADFVFPKLKLIIELDGTHHVKRKHLDDIRDGYLSSKGWKVVRISYKEYQSKCRVSEILQLLHIIF